MSRLPQTEGWLRGLAVTFSAITLAAVAATPSALAASSHASSNGTAHSVDHSSAQPAASDHSTQGTAGTSGDPTQPQPLSGADQQSGGANGQCPGGAYCSTRDGTASGNGNGGGSSTGKPCAGCVGKADNKNPPGQAPDASDGNAGYECDTNHGIARGNPAHTACTTSGGTDCTATPDAPECQGGGTDCTATPDAPECQGGGTDCTATPNAPECVTGGPECTPTAANNFCSTVLGEKVTHTPATRTSSTGTPTTTVLGEKTTRTPSGALPFTGADIALLSAMALIAMVAGTALTLAARRRNHSTG
jgi:hypothetical protein